MHKGDTMKKYLVLTLMLMSVTTLWGAENSATAFLQQGKTYFAAKNYQKAARAFERAASLNPASTEALHGAGMSYLKLGANDGMVNDTVVQQAVEGLKKLGNEALAKGDAATAVRRFEQGLRLAPNDVALQQGLQKAKAPRPASATVR